MNEENDPVWQFENLETKVGQMLIDLRNLLENMEGDMYPPDQPDIPQKEFERIYNKYKPVNSGS